MANIKTVTLDGAELKVDGLNGQNTIVQNLGNVPIYVSVSSGVAANADGVAEIPAGGGVVLYDTRGTIYLLGSGKVQLTGTDYTSVNFEQPSLSNSGGGEADIKTGQASFVQSNNGIISTPLQDTSFETLASTLAAVTGWELQPDSVTVLKEGKVGFRFEINNNSSTVAMTSDTGGGDWFRYTDRTSDLVLDVCKSRSQSAVAWGIRSVTDTPELSFVLAKAENGKFYDLTSYTKFDIHMVNDVGEVQGVLFEYTSDANIVSIIRCLNPVDGTLFKDLYFLFTSSSEPTSGYSFTLGSNEYKLILSSTYERLYSPDKVGALAILI